MKQMMRDCIERRPQQGRLVWIGIRPGKRQEMLSLQSVDVDENGLDGDHYAGSRGRRAVTLMQFEHLDAIAGFLHKPSVTAEALRRNLLVSGINLLALKNRRFAIGPVVLEMTGLCHPCTRMEENLGQGGYNAVRGHGGINARVIETGRIQLGDVVRVTD